MKSIKNFIVILCIIGVICIGIFQPINMIIADGLSIKMLISQLLKCLFILAGMKIAIGMLSETEAKE